jgi:adenosine kinase
MSLARDIELMPIMNKIGKFDLLIVSPDDPEAMLRHTETAISQGVAIAADPSQQLAYMSGDQIRRLIDGATYLFLNEYELALAIQKTGWSDLEILERVKFRVVTLGSEGAKIESKGVDPVLIGCAKEKSKIR